MTQNLFLIFNHSFTMEQEADARALLGVSRIIDLPAELKELWGDIPPDLPALGEYLSPFRAWLLSKTRPGDYVLIQGDFGASFLLVSFALARELVPIYSTTRRVAAEEKQDDGSIRVVHNFEHRLFRKYGF